MGRLTAAAAGLLTVASLAAAPAFVRASLSSGVSGSCAPGYAYAGYASRDGVHGVAATITALTRPAVRSGHAAAWVGVGGVHAGRGGESEWLQAGIAAFPRVGLRLYAEAVSRGEPRSFLDLGRAVRGRRYRVRIGETTPDVWQATIDGHAVGEPAHLPPPRGSWRGVATTETWVAGHAACNSYAYRFESVSVFGSAGWTTPAAAQRVGRAVEGGRAAFAASAG